MSDWFWWTKKIDDHQVAELESMLQLALSPMPPRHSYAYDLQKRLSTPSLEVAFPSPKWPQYLMLAVSWMTVGLALVIFIIRAILIYRMRRS